jgi:Lrp/AsnC family transcriptional regulator for asnA, asnC and gidA
MKENRISVSELDNVDRKIIMLLQENGRRTNANIARIVGMSESTVKNRIDRLIDQEVLSVLAVLNPKAVGINSDVIIGIRVQPGYAESVGDTLKKMNEVVYVGFVTGRFDIMIEVLLKDSDEQYHFLTKEIAEIPGIVSTESFSVMRVARINYEWKLPSDIAQAEGDILLDE